MPLILRRTLLLTALTLLTVSGLRAQDAAERPEVDGEVLTPVTLEYVSTVEIQGREMESKLTRTLDSTTLGGTPVWQVIDRVVTPVGSALDTFALDRTTLAPVYRRSQMGDAVITLDYGAEAVTGTVQAGGQTTSIDTPLERPVLADGGALELTLATLPLEPGYETTFRIYSVQANRVRPMRLSVTGAGTAQLGSDEVATYTVEIHPLGRESAVSTLKVTQKAPHYVVHNTTERSPEMGAGRATMRLQSIEVPDSSH